MDEARYVIEAGTPGRPNEDCVVAGPDWSPSSTGRPRPPGVKSECVHDVR